MTKKILALCSFTIVLVVMAFGYFDGPQPPCIPKPGQNCPLK